MKNQAHFRICFIVLICIVLALILTACGSEPLHPYSYRQHEKVDDGFGVGTLYDTNMAETLLESTIDDTQPLEFFGNKIIPQVTRMGEKAIEYDKE